MNGHMPRSVAKRIMKRTAESDEPIVITVRGGKPSRVFGFAEYKKMVALPGQVKPWEHRREKKRAPDPLGAVDSKPPGAISREDIYE